MGRGVCPPRKRLPATATTFHARKVCRAGTAMARSAVQSIASCPSKLLFRAVLDSGGEFGEPGPGPGPDSPEYTSTRSSSARVGPPRARAETSRRAPSRRGARSSESTISAPGRGAGSVARLALRKKRRGLCGGRGPLERKRDAQRRGKPGLTGVAHTSRFPTRNWRISEAYAPAGICSRDHELVPLPTSDTCKDRSTNLSEEKWS